MHHQLSKAHPSRCTPSSTHLARSRFTTPNAPIRCPLVISIAGKIVDTTKGLGFTTCWPFKAQPAWHFMHFMPVSPPRAVLKNTMDLELQPILHSTSRCLRHLAAPPAFRGWYLGHLAARPAVRGQSSTPSCSHPAYRRWVCSIHMSHTHLKTPGKSMALHAALSATLCFAGSCPLPIWLCPPRVLRTCVPTWGLERHLLPQPRMGMSPTPLEPA